MAKSAGGRYNNTMAFKIFRNDITKVRADAIVNTANHRAAIGRGTDSAIYRAAGSEALFEARRKIGTIEIGQSAWTKSFLLAENGVKYIIHTVGTHFIDGNSGEQQLLRSCYRTALDMAQELHCKSVALPLLATGHFGFPKELALEIAIDEISRFILENDIDVFLVVYDAESYKISERLFYEVEDFLSEHLESDSDFCAESIRVCSSCASSISAQKSEKNALADFISESEKTLNFQDTLQKLIAERNLDNATVYKKALIDKKFFSKIICHKNYVPKKQTVMALALALELPLADFEAFLASAGYAFMPSSTFDMIIKFCVIHRIFNLLQVDILLDDHGLQCFSPK